MRNSFLSGTACAALCLVSFSGAARSATLDDVMARLDKIEKENAELRQKVRSLSAAKPVAASSLFLWLRAVLAMLLIIGPTKGDKVS